MFKKYPQGITIGANGLQYKFEVYGWVTDDTNNLVHEDNSNQREFIDRLC